MKAFNDLSRRRLSSFPPCRDKMPGMPTEGTVCSGSQYPSVPCWWRHDGESACSGGRKRQAHSQLSSALSFQSPWTSVGLIASVKPPGKHPHSQAQRWISDDSKASWVDPVKIKYYKRSGGPVFSGFSMTKTLSPKAKWQYHFWNISKKHVAMSSLDAM